MKKNTYPTLIGSTLYVSQNICSAGDHAQKDDGSIEWIKLGEPFNINTKQKTKTIFTIEYHPEEAEINANVLILNDIEQKTRRLYKLTTLSGDYFVWKAKVKSCGISSYATESLYLTLQGLA